MLRKVEICLVLYSGEWFQNFATLLFYLFLYFIFWGKSVIVLTGTLSMYRGTELPELWKHTAIKWSWMCRSCHNSKYTVEQKSLFLSGLKDLLLPKKEEKIVFKKKS